MQILTFILNDVEFGIPVSDVMGIETKLDITPIPVAPAHLKGITSLHDNIIPIYSLISRFNYPEQQILNTIIVSVGEVQLGLEVGYVKEIMELPDKQIIPMPVIMNECRDFFENVASNNRHLIVLITADHLLSEQDREALQKVIEDNQEG